jgi:Methyltransferase domain
MAEDEAADLDSFEHRVRQLRSAAELAGTREAALAGFKEVLALESDLHRIESLDRARRDGAVRGLHRVGLQLLDLGLRAHPAAATPSGSLLGVLEELELLNTLAYIEGATGEAAERLAAWMTETERSLAAFFAAISREETLLHELLEAMELAHWIYTAAADQVPALAARAEALWTRWVAAAMTHPIAVRALALRVRARDAGWRYAEIEQHATALAEEGQAPAGSIIALMLGGEPAPFGPGQDGEVRSGRTGYGATPVATLRPALSALELGRGDTFYDLGSGLGLPTLIAALSSEAACRGVEYHRHYVERAEENARQLGLSGVRFHCGDASTFDWTDGNKFYMFDPFPADVLERVAARLLEVARERPIRVACYANRLPSPGFRLIHEMERVAVFEAGPDIGRR